MKVQFYAKYSTSKVRVFRNDANMLFELNDNDACDLETIDATLRFIGWQRRTKWLPTEWGFEASVRRIRKGK